MFRNLITLLLLLISSLAFAQRGAQINWSDPLNRGLIAWWKIDENDGDTVQDLTPNANHGTLINMDPPTDWVSGRPGGFGSLEFDGANDHIELDSHVGNIEGLSAGTITGWFRDDSSGSDTRLFTISEGASNNNMVEVSINGITSNYTDESFNFRLTRGGTVQLQMHVRNGDNFYSDGLWHHFAVVTGGGDNRIYIDAVSQSITFQNGSATTTEFSNINSADAMKIGARRRNGTTDRFLEGQLNDFRIYDRALSEAEVRELYVRSQRAYNRLVIGDDVPQAFGTTAAAFKPRVIFLSKRKPTRTKEIMYSLSP